MLRICYIDIEMETLPSIKEDAKILNIGFYDNFEESFYSLIWNPSFKEERKEVDFYSHSCQSEKTINVYTFRSEKGMLNFFLSAVKQFDWDILTAWNSDFDIRNLVNRMKVLGVDYKELSPIKVVTDKKIYGRLEFDLLKGFRKIHFSEMKSFRLFDVMRREFDIKVGDSPKKLSDLQKNSPNELILYNAGHVDAIVLIDMKMKVIEYFDTIRKVSGCRFEDVFSNSRVLDAIVLGKINKKLPTKKEGSECASFKGAIVLDPKIGFVLKNIIVLDLSKIYPSIVMSANISPETFIGYTSDFPEGELKKYIVIDDIVIEKLRRGEVSKIYNDLFAVRKSIEDELYKQKYGSPEWYKFERKKEAIKSLINSFYGVLGYSKFRIYTPDLARSVTYLGRNLINFCKMKIEDLGYEIIYGDTDSIFVQSKKSDINDQVREGKYLAEYLNDHFDEFARKFNIDNHFFHIDFESIYWSVFFKEKKRYAGMKSYNKGKIIPYEEMIKIPPTVKGFESKRSDSSDFQEKFQNEMFFDILTRREPEHIAKKVFIEQKKIENGEYSPDYIAFRAPIRKPLEEYTKTTPPVIAGARWMNKHFGMHFSVGDKLKWIYVKRVSGYPSTHVVAFEKEEDIPDCVEIDWKVMANKNVMEKAMQLFECLGWERYLSNVQTLDEYFVQPKSL